MYSIGQLVLYGRTGVCRVEEICERVLPGDKTPHSFYTLQPLYQSCKVNIPVDNTKVFIRPIISAEEALLLIKRLPELEAAPYHNRNLNQLREHYRSCIESYSCEELALMTISIWRKRKECEASKRKLGAVDERFMHEAEGLLFGELAAALNMDKDSMPQFIRNVIAGKEEL